jgi:MFS transporter, NNP family, nitrate/nitrite transporter
MTDRSRGLTVLTMNTIAFTVCFAAWMMNGVLITFLVENGLYDFSKSEIGWLIGIPVLTGSLVRLPVGIWTDEYGGRKVFTLVLLVAALAMYLTSYADSYLGFALGGLGFGLAGTGFAVGIAYTSVWFKKENQGTALGIFGVGNAGASLTSIFAPQVLNWLTDGGANLEGWRNLPKLYAASLLVMAVIFFFATFEKKAENGRGRTFVQRLAPLKVMRVWRFGLYYFFVFGGYVALSQWMIPYYVNAYQMSIATAGLVAAIFSLPSGVIRALGGWMSDLWGARAVMYWVLGVSLICCAMLIVPRMDIETPGAGVNALVGGTITNVGADFVELTTKGGIVRKFPFKPRAAVAEVKRDEGILVWPTVTNWQEPIVGIGDEVVRKQLLARGISHIFFQANVWIFTGIVFVLGIAMGIGKAAVYRHIPDYFPTDVGVVGGIVGVIGGLGGFVCPIIFGYLLEGTGLWTSCWIFFGALVIACLAWMHLVVRSIMAKEAPDALRLIEHGLKGASA